MKSIADNLRMRDNRIPSGPFISTKWNQARRARALRQHQDHVARFHTKGTQEELDRGTLGPWYDWAVLMKAEEAHAQRVAKAQAAMRYRARAAQQTG
jgi:hypothetical protein